MVNNNKIHKNTLNKINKNIVNNKDKNMLKKANKLLNFSYITKFYRNNEEVIKALLSFILAIGLIIILYSIYKYYKNRNTEPFINQEPYDLLDKIKSNIYSMESVWDNQLFKEQPEVKELPISFWNITKQDSNYKIIGQAVNNITNELKQGEPVAPKEKTMLVDGDTKVPESVNLIYRIGNNQITEKIKNENGENVFRREFNNIRSIKDIDERLDIFKNMYDLFIEGKKSFERYMDSKLIEIKENMYFPVKLYSKGNFFSNPNMSINSTLSKQAKSSNGEFNMISFPIIANLDLTFTNNVTYNYKSNINRLINTENNIIFNKIKSEHIFTNLNNQNIFNNRNFNLFGEFGMVRNNLPAYTFKQINNAIPLEHNSRVHNRKRKDKDKNTSMAFNYIVSDNETFNNSAFKDMGKYKIYEYLNNINTSNRNDYISDDDAKLYIYDVRNIDRKEYSNEPLKILFSQLPSSGLEIESIFGFEKINTRKYRNTKDPVTLEIKNTETNKEGFVSKMEGTIESVSLPNLTIENNLLNFNIKYNQFDNFIEKYDVYRNTYSWLNDFLEFESNIFKFDLFNNNELNNFVTNDGTNKILNISMGMPYINFVFQIPIFVYRGSLNYRYLTQSNIQSWPSRFQYFGSKSSRNMTRISYINQFKEYKDVHNIPEIKNQLLKSVTVSYDESTINNLPNTRILTYIKNTVFNNINNFELKLVDKLNSLNNLRNIILSNQFKHFPIKIYRPNPPKYYKSLGDLIYSQNNNFDTVESNFFSDEPDVSQIACVPEQCVREVREWLPIDKIYEYQEGTTYLAIYKNPYLQTFRAVTNPGALPPGKVEKIVACVERCKLVDDIIQADKCAKTFYKTHKNISDSFNMDPDNVFNERKNNIYKNKIVERENRINSLKETARRLQVQDDKANVINQTYNRNKLQDLVDKQKMNMHKLVDNLEKGKNKIAINVKFNYDKLFELCSNGNLPSDVCQFIRNNIKPPSSSLTDAQRTQFDQQALQAILDSCPTVDIENYVKRTLVENNCGCYFTDRELEEEL